MLKKTVRMQEKAEMRLQLLDQETRHQLLKIKELQQQKEQLEHRVREMTWVSSPELSGLPVTSPEPLKEDLVGEMPLPVEMHLQLQKPKE
jgi:hypothetical protein